MCHNNILVSYDTYYRRYNKDCFQTSYCGILMSDEKQKISIEQLRIEELESRHLGIIKSFETDCKELKDFLIEDAFINQQIAISKTYLWFYNPTNDFVGYITLLTDAIRVHGTNLGKRFIDMGIQYRTLPAIKIGRMCVDKKYSGRGIGTNMIYFSMKNLVELEKRIGCRFIVLDAKTTTHAANFYKRFGFEILKDRNKGTIPMFNDMIKIIEYQREQRHKNKRDFK